MQYTDRDTVYDLYGPSTCIGASGGPSWYVGLDAISFSDVTDSNGEINGFQLTAGFGGGLDVHVIESNTKSLLYDEKRNMHDSIREKRIAFCYKTNTI